MEDKVLESFLRDGQARMNELAGSSDVFHILHTHGDPATRYLCSFKDVEHLIRDGEGMIRKSTDPILTEIRFPPDYLHSCDPHLGLKVVGVVCPIFHPNIAPPSVCLGSAFRPGTPAEEIVRMVYEVVSFQNVTPDERDAFSPEACRYVREHPEELASLRIPPLRRRRVSAAITVENLA
jgi:hypothetical protein